MTLTEVSTEHIVEDFRRFLRGFLYDLEAKNCVEIFQTAATGVQ